jgi:hypothetical protein
LKFLTSPSSLELGFSVFVETELPFGKNLALLVNPTEDEFYYEIFASLKLEILGICFVYSMTP